MPKNVDGCLLPQAPSLAGPQSWDIALSLGILPKDQSLIEQDG